MEPQFSEYVYIHEVGIKPKLTLIGDMIVFLCLRKKLIY